MIQEKYEQLCLTPSDINENLPVLKKYAEQSDSIVELGVRAIVSTWALLAGKPKILVSVDIEDPSVYGGNLMEVYDAANQEDINFSFIKASSLEITIPEVDMLFIDTIHTKDFLSQELAKHADKVKKFIAFHDTAIPDLPEMAECVNEFLASHPEWQVAEHHVNNNGLTVIKRV